VRAWARPAGNFGTGTSPDFGATRGTSESDV
jgi:hypothetical protein